MANQCSQCFFVSTDPDDGVTLHCCVASPPARADWQKSASLWPVVRPTDWCGQGVDQASGLPFNPYVPTPWQMSVFLDTPATGGNPGDYAWQVSHSADTAALCQKNQAGAWIALFTLRVINVT